MTAYQKLQIQLKRSPKTWLVTGAAGFIGSNLVEALLKLNQRVIGLDNFSTGHRKNLNEVQSLVSKTQWSKFKFISASICDLTACQQVCRNVDYVLHQAALGSVPASMDRPIASHDNNVSGFLNMLIAARDSKVRSFVYASSSAVYGDASGLPKVEERIGQPLSPYAATKRMNELYAITFANAFGLNSIGLRYFNVFGPRQDPNGAYAAVIPKWIAAFLMREPVRINGDGKTSRDFCYVQNVVQANLLAATTKNPKALNQIYNIAVGERTTLNELFRLLKNGLRQRDSSLPDSVPIYQDFRRGDVRHSLADIGKGKRLLGFRPTHTIHQGLEDALDWYKQDFIART